MIAAVYARKSTEQAGVADDQKSVARQIDHARGYATRKGWNVADEHVYVDDRISGAEFANRPGFLRLMNALKPSAPLYQNTWTCVQPARRPRTVSVRYAIYEVEAFTANGQLRRATPMNGRRWRRLIVSESAGITVQTMDDAMTGSGCATTRRSTRTRSRSRQSSIRTTRSR